jgi:hypothetical protein
MGYHSLFLCSSSPDKFWAIPSMLELSGLGDFELASEDGDEKRDRNRFRLSGTQRQP